VASVTTLVGDINADCKIDIIDLATVGAAFASSPPSPRWNPNADINTDGFVDIIDLVLVAAHFGQACPS